MALHPAVGRRVIAVGRPPGQRRMAVPASEPTAILGKKRRITSPAVAVLLSVMAVAYAGFFIYLEWLRYHNFLMHALDMGNMEQAAWNTGHGYLWPPFQFNNLRFPWGIEAAGTTTRLGFHVEPIFFLLAIPYIVYSSPVILMVIQAVVVASGVFPAAWLARKYLRLPLAQLAFPLVYLLAPPLEAASLYEFHPVTLSAGLLLWALYFADARRYGLFAIFGVLAMGTKEEIGIVVAVFGLWIWWRHRDRTAGLTTAIVATAWSIFAVAVIMRHFGPHGHSSPYCARFNPYQINGRFDALSKVSTCTGVAKIWLQHPDQVLSILVMGQKLGFLHRMFMPVGYLALLSPLTLAISLPSYALILFSNDVHMYSGLGHYPAELVPILIGSAIIGIGWLAYRVGPRLRLPPAAITTVACAWLLVASLANQRVNGFTPLYEGFALPQETYHTRIGRHILSLIPANAAVSADDYLNPHLSDRRNIYLFPDVGDAQYVAVDASRDNFPIGPVSELAYIRDIMLRPGTWGVVDAEDGYILMERRTLNPGLRTTLPDSFYTFALPTTAPVIAHPMTVNFGPYLQLRGYKLERREEVNLRQPDVLLTTYWRVIGPLTQAITPVIYLTNSQGAIDVRATDHPTTDWLPTTRWPRARDIVLQTVPLTVFTNDNGWIDIDLAVYQPGTYNVLSDEAHRYRPDVRWAGPGEPGTVQLETVARGTILKLAHVAAIW